MNKSQILKAVKAKFPNLDWDSEVTKSGEKKWLDVFSDSLTWVDIKVTCTEENDAVEYIFHIITKANSEDVLEEFYSEESLEEVLDEGYYYLENTLSSDLQTLRNE